MVRYIVSRRHFGHYIVSLPPPRCRGQHHAGALRAAARGRTGGRYQVALGVPQLAEHLAAHAVPCECARGVTTNGVL